MTNFKSNFFIVLASIILSLYLFEMYLNLIDEKKDFKKIKKIYKNETGKNFDERTPREIFEDLKDSGFVMSVPPTVHINRNSTIFPLSGISKSETIVCNENGYYSKYKSDRYGFNNLDSEWDEKNVEFLLIGDSFVQGGCVNRPNDIGSVLRNLSNKPVLNLGYGGNGPLIEYATLIEYFQPNVKNVLWFYYEGNDFYDLDNEIRDNTLIKYLNEKKFSQKLRTKQKQIDKINKDTINQSFFGNKLQNIKKNSKIKYKVIKFIRLDKTKNVIKNMFKVNSIDYSYDKSNFKKIIEKTTKYLEKSNSNFYFIYLPKLERYLECRYKPCNDDRIYKKKLMDHKRMVKKIVNEYNVIFIDVDKEVFEVEDDKLKLFPFEIMDHYNAKGYRKVATKIYDIISNN